MICKFHKVIFVLSGQSRTFPDGTVCEGNRNLNDQWQTPGKCNKCTCLQSGKVTCERWVHLSSEVFTDLEGQKLGEISTCV